MAITYNNRTTNCVVTSNNSSWEQYHYIFQNDTLTLTCNSGYSWNNYTTRPRITITNTLTGTSISRYFTVSQDGTTATWTNDTESDYISNVSITLIGKPGVIASGIPITYTLNHCTISPNNAYYSQAVTFTATADTGYEFNVPPILRYTDTNNETHSINFTLSNDVYTLDTTYINSELLVSESIEIESSATAIIRPLILDLPNTVTMSPTINNVSYGETINFTLQAAESVNITGVKMIVDGIEIPLYSQTDSYSYTFDTLTSSSVVTLSVQVENKITVVYNLTRCTVQPHFTYYNGENNFYFTFTANENCVFATAPIIRLTPTNTIQATRESDTVYKAYFYLSSSDIDNLTGIEVVATAILDENAVTNKYGIVSVFKVNKEIMRNVMRKRFYNGTITALHNTDLAQYITSLKWLYLNVESETESNIILGFSDTQVQAPLILDDDIELDLGTFTINGIYSNNLDINLVETIKVTLPFINDVILPNTCINHSIHIKYNINVITGNCKAFIYDVIDSADVLIATYDGNMSIDVPYIFKTGVVNATVNNNGISQNSNLLNVPPRIIVSEYEKTGDNVFMTDKYDKIKNEIGYFKVDKIKLESDCLSVEKSMIESILKTGCYI